jgi:hypothetical protein
MDLRLYIVRRIPNATRSISFSHPNRACALGQAVLADGLGGSVPRGRKSVVSQGHFRTQADRRSRLPVAVPAVPYLNNILKQITGRLYGECGLVKDFRSFDGLGTIQGIETVQMIRKGQVRRLPKGAIAEQLQFVAAVFAIPTEA